MIRGTDSAAAHAGRPAAPGGRGEKADRDVPGGLENECEEPGGEAARQKLIRTLRRMPTLPLWKEISGGRIPEAARAGGGAESSARMLLLPDIRILTAGCHAGLRRPLQQL